MDKKAMLDDLFDLFFTVIAGFFLLLFIGVIINGTVDDDNKASFEGINLLKGDEVLLNYLNTPINIVWPTAKEDFSVSTETTFLELILQMKETSGGSFTGIDGASGSWNNQFDGWKFVRASENALGQEMLSLEIKDGENTLLNWKRSGLSAGGNRLKSEFSFQGGQTIKLEVAQR